MPNKEVRLIHQLMYEIVERKKKGFGIPLSSWMRQFDSTNLKNGIFLINQEKIMSIWDNHKNRKEDWRYACWSDVVLNKYSIKNKI